MPDDCASPKWATPIYQKHQWASAHDWRISNARRRTENPTTAAVYDPGLAAAEIRRLEMGCVETDRSKQHGHLIKQTKHKRVYYHDAGTTIGASAGEFTSFILVYWECLSGNVHGYPVTRNDLRNKWKVKL